MNVLAAAMEKAVHEEQCLQQHATLKPRDIFENKVEENNKDLEEYDRVEINPEAVRLGLTKSRIKNVPKIPEPKRQQQHEIEISFDEDHKVNQHQEKMAMEPPAPPTKPNGLENLFACAEKMSENDDTFGISYKPIKVPEAETYHVPSGPAFEDEAEFERELSTSLYQQQEADDDDDFDYDFDAVDETMAAKTNAAIRVESSSDKVKESNIVEQMKAEVAASLVVVDEAEAEEEPAKPKPLSEIIASTASGSNDTSAHEIYSVSEPVKPAEPAIVDIHQVETNVHQKLDALIEEGDEEDDDEDEEEEEEEEQQQQVLQDDQEKQELMNSTHTEEEHGEIDDVDTDWDNLDNGVTPVTDINFELSLAHFLSDEANLEQFRDQIIMPTPKPSSHFSNLSSMLSRKKKGDEMLPNIDTMLMIAKVPLDWTNLVHQQIIVTIFRTLLNTDDSNCACTGNHWEKVGFQGNDPATDLRDAGMFGLLQMVWLCKNHAQLASSAFQQSVSPTRHFPFMAVSLNFSLICIRAIRKHPRASSYPCCNTDDAVNVANELFLQMWTQMEKKWRANKLTIQDFPRLLKTLQEMALKKPKLLFTN